MLYKGNFEKKGFDPSEKEWGGVGVQWIYSRGSRAFSTPSLKEGEKGKGELEGFVDTAQIKSIYLW